MNITVVASGSNGNSTLIQHKNTSILIDAGKSMKEIETRLSKIGKSLETLDAVLLSHAHIDHYRSVGVISRKFNVPVYMTSDTYRDCSLRLGKIKRNSFCNNKRFKIKDMDILPIDTTHDVSSCGFLINKFGLFTDTGRVTEDMKKAIFKCKGLLLESNYDYDMLLKGAYPIYLKQRIMSNQGHLSNFDAGFFVNEYGKHLDWVLLGHLSENNNSVTVAKKTFETTVKKNIDYSVLSRNKLSGSWELK